MPALLRVPPFPPLSWDGWSWHANEPVAWYSNSEAPQLWVRPDPGRAAEIKDPDRAPRPTEVQAATYLALRDPEAPLKVALLDQFRKYVPELENAGWDALEALFALEAVLIFHPASQGVAYVGLVFGCLDYQCGYEHGVGVVIHQDRVVHFGMAEEAEDETQALKDLRRLARAERRGKAK